MVLFGASCDKDVVQINDNSFDALQKALYDPLEYSWCWWDSERESRVTKQPLTTRNFHELLSSGSCWHAWLKSSLEEYFPLLSRAKRSTTLGIGYPSSFDTRLIVKLKSPQILTLLLSGFRTTTIGAAHSAMSSGSIVPSSWSCWSSLSTLSLRAYGTDLAGCGVVSGSTWISALNP